MGNVRGGEVSGSGFFLGEDCPGGNYPGGKLSAWGYCPEGNCPRGVVWWEFTGHRKIELSVIKISSTETKKISL